ncbi:secretion protein HlyD [Niastella yeongjuensis]|uniref:Secretion protein HlyD n=1 Tax=Niastella yeongjuensis TaxID=354355 RepID=A0A1V9F2P9_9BACT|nr:HlyD family secretion protein [Niastella yeongjuensis]OQP52525.1 secretion protein HlyD [Niastella yeongjuensis]SEP34874.1 membrane fusion protein, multidrug efflux system [Niastella yeongjuensis]
MATTQQTGAEAAPKKKSRGFLIVLIILVIVGGAFGISKYLHAKHHEETDDAQVEANINPVIPKISGYVTEVRVKDNQPVKKGDTLLLLDDRDLKLKLDQAEAALGTAKSNLTSARATSQAAVANIGTSAAAIKAADAQIEAAKVSVWQATQDYNRYANLIKDHSITLQQFEGAQAAKEKAEKQLQVLQEQRNQAARATNAVSTQSNATGTQVNVASSTIKQRLVDVEDAKLNLSYTVVTAPADGITSKINVQAGQYLQAGQATFSVIQDNDIWVVANFKETQFHDLRIGQKVTINVDAFPGHDFDATVTSFSPATGARFALLPPDNASGNFVKVVQRLPVKIEFNKQDSLVKQLKAGMNVNVDVHLD